MKRSDQSGAHAPRKGTMLRQSAFGMAAYTTKAIERFPPPEFLSDMQKNLWIAALGDVPLEFFRARHIPIMIQYVRAVEIMMKFSDAYEADHEDDIAFARWTRMMTVVSRLERHMSLNTEALISMVIRARTELKLAHQAQKRDEASEDSSSLRRGLTYVGH